MISRLVIRNLLHRPIRTGLSVLAVAVEVAMILLMVGLSDGLLQESQRRTRGVGADIMVRPSTSSAAMSLGAADIPEKMAEKLVELFPEIQSAMGVVVSTPGDLQTITGVEWDRFTVMADGVRFFEGRGLEGEFDAVVDDVYARHRKLSVGDKVRFLNRDFTLVGIIESGKMSRVFVPIATMQDVMGWEGSYSQLFLKLHDPEETRDVIAKVKQALPTYPVYAIEDFLALAAADIQAMAGQFVNVIIAIAVAIGFIVVLLSMYTAILERTREIGILKALGGSKAYIITVVLRESGAVCAMGILVGFGIGYLGKAVAESNFPLITILIDPEWLLWSAVIAVVGSTLGALYPAARAARQDPIDALAYE